jgi:hypothetical protein
VPGVFMTALLRIIFLSAALGHQASAATLKALISTDCGTVLPAPITELLTSQFPEWRPKQLSDLESDDRQLWLKAHPQECPGIAVGHYQPGDELSYAVFLVPKSDPTNGYQLIVVGKKAAQAAYNWKLLDRAKGQAYSGIVVSTAKPGNYSDFEDTKSVVTKLDGIYLEWIEKGAVLYYWSNGHYLKLRVSD